MRNIRDLVLFLEVVKTGSFSQAARRQHVTPSAVSKAIARLENETRSRLFDRNSYQLAVTPEGKSFASAIAEALALFDDAFHRLDDVHDHASGHLRIAAIASFGEHFVVPLLPLFQRLYPDITVEIVFDEGLPDLIAEGFDLAIRRGPIGERDTVIRRLCAIDLALVASRGYVEAHGRPSVPADLADHECVAIQFASRRKAHWIFVDAADQSHAIVPRGRLLLSEQPVGALIRLIEAGAGVAMVARSFVHDRLASGEFVELLSDYRIERPVEMFVQLPGRRHTPPRVRAFVEFLVAQVQQDPRLTAAGPEEGSTVVRIKGKIG